MAARTVKLGGGVEVPYPEPFSAAASNVGRGNRRSNSSPERQLASELHRRGRRFRRDLLIRAIDVSVRPDIVFTRRRVAVFIDGCFWHGCPEHGRVPKTNVSYWGPKLARNIERDRRVDAALVADGWRVVRVWEHEVADGVARVEASLDR